MVRRLAFLLWLLLGAAALSQAQDSTRQRALDDSIAPFLRTYCIECHGEKKQEAKLDLRPFESWENFAEQGRTWEHIAQRLADGDMPPEKASRFPNDAERQSVVRWIGKTIQEQADRNAGDPGRVLPRRLSNSEFDYAILDLTGVDLHPAREFPVDPANEEGFDNTGESLAMSPALLQKYLAAARRVADHVVFKPHGFDFAPYSAVTETDRDRYCVERIVDFYGRHSIDYADYLYAAWRCRLANEHGPVETREQPPPLRDFARQAGLSPKYLELVWQTLTALGPEFGPLGEIRALWRQLPNNPAPDPDERAAQQMAARRECERIRDHIVARRKEFSSPPPKLESPGISPGSQTLVLWRNRALAESRRRYHDPAPRSPRSTGYDDSCRRFCEVFPDAFFIVDRGPYFDPSAAGQGRLLTAGFHLMQGYFRDDGPLVDLVLDEDEARELDALWLELNFVTSAPLRQFRDFVFFERAEPPRFAREAAFDFARSEDHDVTSPEKMERLAKLYRAKALKQGAGALALAAIDEYFEVIGAEIRSVENQWTAAAPTHLAALVELASRAYRRPLSVAERDSLLDFYRRLREEEKLGHEDAARDSIARVILSPHFVFRADVAPPGNGVAPLSDGALASRLSFFLWSSGPDAEISSLAAESKLQEPEILAEQARRMLQDPKFDRFAKEFVGAWLDIRRFDEHNGVDRERFPSFTNELRQAMQEEPIRFFASLARENGSLLDLLDADYTFVNSFLARHYGIPEPSRNPDAWVRVDNAHEFGRGGLPPMAVFLTKNSPGRRTSPVKRGYWVVRKLLGERIPPPPPSVPELPPDESAKIAESLPRMLARHREHASCAACHEKFDSVGLTFEGYGPVGERREVDGGGRPVECKATFPTGEEGVGLDGLRTYLTQNRRAEFVANFCRKLLAYALGRGLIPSDRSLLVEMQRRLEEHEYRVGEAIETIVTSRQFRFARGHDYVSD